MYQEHWNFKALPFENTPDMRFFYESREHEEAFSRLQYLVGERKACGVLTGTYGCGKTLLLHSLVQTTGSEGAVFSMVTNPRLDDLGLLRLILHGFTRSEVPTVKADVLMGLEKFVTGVAEDGKHCVVVIDEAHAIEDPKVFEELRLLLNFQTEDRSLVTLILAGQSELKGRVESNKQFNQRVNLRCHLGPFQPVETKAYIEHRLQVASGGVDPAEVIFPNPVLALVHKLSGGIPRWINQICHLSLMVAFDKGVLVVTPEIVQEAVRDMVGAK